MLDNRPSIITLYNPYGIGHVVVFAGFDEATGRVALVDPSAPNPGRRMVSEGEFSRIWRAGPEDRCAILTQPKA